MKVLMFYFATRGFIFSVQVGKVIFQSQLIGFIGKEPMISLKAIRIKRITLANQNQIQ